MSGRVKGRISGARACRKWKRGVEILIKELCKKVQGSEFRVNADEDIFRV